MGRILKRKPWLSCQRSGRSIQSELAYSSDKLGDWSFDLVLPRVTIKKSPIWAIRRPWVRVPLLLIHINGSSLGFLLLIWELGLKQFLPQGVRLSSLHRGKRILKKGSSVLGWQILRLNLRSPSLPGSSRDWLSGSLNLYRVPRGRSDLSKERRIGWRGRMMRNSEIRSVCRSHYTIGCWSFVARGACILLWVS